jgi:hypothetical protein
MNTVQVLQQKICQKFGWSCMFDFEHVSSVDADDSQQQRWCVNVIVGLQENDKRHFEAEKITSQDDSKLGMADAASVAIRGLQDEILRQEQKHVVDLNQVFCHELPLDIYDSTRENWDFFWQHQVAVVGIDVEGNQRCPPVLVQISTADYTILEAPQKDRGISADLARLLADESIIKVFCDNSSHKDKKSLGLDRSSLNNDLTTGHIVDLEALAMQVLGPVNVMRGLTRILTLCMPEANVLIRKSPHGRAGTYNKGRRRFNSNNHNKTRYSDVQRFSLIEQGKAPELRGLQDLTFEQQQYAALDAWSTLFAYTRIQQHLATASRQTSPC